MQNPSPVSLSVLIPAFNEEANLPGTVRALYEELNALVPSFELLIVDDASFDRTHLVAEQLASTYPCVRVFHHNENRGIGEGFHTGVLNARGNWFILIPADLALVPNQLAKYLDAAHEADIVVGLRSDKSDYTLIRRFVSWSNIALIRFLFGMREHQFQYISLYRTQILREIDIEFIRSAFFFAEILIKAKACGYRLKEVEITYIPRRTGRATGANPRLILRTGRDMLHYWWRGRWRKRS